MATDNPGVYGRYTGTGPSQTPANDVDLHGPGDNPYGNGMGTPPADLTRPLGYGQGPDAVNRTAADNAHQTPYDVSAPYYANPPARGGNPYAALSAPSKSEPGDQQAAANIAAGLEALYAHTLGNYTGAGVGGSPADVNNDEGYGPTGTGRS
jgi:hypothetical protein